MDKGSTVYVGKPLSPREDLALVQGQGTYVDDFHFAGMLEAAFVRSPHAHARIRAINLDAALALPGVCGIFVYSDLPTDARSFLPALGDPSLNIITDPILADGEVRYVGEPVAVVLAEDRYVAEDGADLVAVSYEPLPASVALERALDPDAPLVHPETGTNLVGERTWATGDVTGAFGNADLILKEVLRVHRGTSSPIETRGIVVFPETRTGFLMVWASTQSPHRVRDMLAALLRIPVHQIRVMAPAVGGGFGPKSGVYPEDFLIPWLAQRLGRPVKWIEDRREYLLCARQERDQVHRVEIALSRDGRILGLKDEFLYDVGAYSSTIISPWTTAYTIPGPYRISNLSLTLRLAFTHKVPTMTVRGAGRPQAVFVMERLVERAARALKIDPAEIRRRNLITPEDIPWDTGLTTREGERVVYECGNFPDYLNRVLEKIGYDRFRNEKKEAGRIRRGIGIASYVETTGMGPYEVARVALDSNGKVTVYAGTAPQGQGHQTVLSQICGEELGVDPAEIRVITGDTAFIPFGIGTFASRSGVTAGNAVSMAARSLGRRLREYASREFSCPADRVFLAEGKIHVEGEVPHVLSLSQFMGQLLQHRPERKQQIIGPPLLEESAVFTPDRHSHAAGAHAAIVEVDLETGGVKILRYAVVHDCGRVLNPIIVEGQIQGGVVHGIGNALLERVAYDENGQVLSGSFMDYLLPTAAEAPRVEIGLVETPSPVNPYGIKGVGESGTMPAPAVLMAAIEDALRPLDIFVRSVPMSPEELLNLIDSAKNSVAS
ncbi:MAG TPA: xanthine dehydrogenase family protein molybdopterin-binding subunit [bacterium]|nr:xanthine dehydrogenase family protein molybdopterin-binding subunit [bacterium]